MPAWIENLITGATSKVSRMMGSWRSSPEQVEMNQLSSKFRRRFNQMQDRLEAPPGKISRISNLAPSDNRRQDSLLPLSILIVGAVAVAIGLAFDLALVINAGGIPGVFVLPTITKTTDATQVNSVVNKVAAVVDDLAGDEEEYIVEDQAEDFAGEYEIEDNLFEDGGDNDNDDDDDDDDNDNEDKEEGVEEEKVEEEEEDKEKKEEEEEEKEEEVNEAKEDSTEEGHGESEEETEIVMENSDHAMAEEKKETQASSEKVAEESGHETEARATEENLEHQSVMSLQESESEEVKEEANQKVESGDQEEERETRKEDDIAAGQTTKTKKDDVAPTSTDEVAVTSSSTWIGTGSKESEATIKRQEEKGEEEKFYKNAPVNTKKEEGLDDILEAGDWFTAE